MDGINVTVPFKKSVISFLDKLTPLANQAQSVNTIFKKDSKIIGDNTDIGGFEHGLKHINYNVKKQEGICFRSRRCCSFDCLSFKKIGCF